VSEIVDPNAPGDARLRSSSRGRDEAPLADTVMVGSCSLRRAVCVEAPSLPWLSGTATPILVNDSDG